MAKRNPYSRNRNSNNGRILALLALIALLVVVIWLTQANTAPDINKDDLDQAMLSQSQANKELAESSPQGKPTENQTQTPLPTRQAANESPKTTPPPQNLAAQQVAEPVKPPAQQPAKPLANQQLTKETSQPNQGPVEAPKLFLTGKTAFEAKDYLKARDDLSDAVKKGLSQDQDRQARQMLNAAADQWLFSRSTFGLDEFCRRHKVASGEMLAGIGNNYSVPFELIQRINNISNPRNLGAGQTLKVVQGPFHALVELSKFRLTVYLGDVLVRTYPISIGQPGRETPTGLWQVMVKQPNPAWTDPETNKRYLPNDPDNPLGERWIGLEGLEGDAVGRTGFGIHGTINPQDIGTATSRGCMRLYNGDVRELYDLLVTNKSRVRVVQ